MTVKKIWMSPNTARNSRYGLRTLGGVLGIALLMTALAVGGTLLGLGAGLPREVFSLLVVALVTALGVYLGLRLGRRSLGDAVVFYLTQDDRLYVLDVRTLTWVGASPASQAAWAMATQEQLRRLAGTATLPAEAREICRVTRLRERRGDWVVHCQCRVPGGGTAPHTCFVVKGYEDEDLLLRQLERRQTWQGGPDLPENRTPLYIALSGGVLAVLGVLCVLSHPAVGRLPAGMYFPCLGAALAAVFALVYFCVRQSRGE